MLPILAQADHFAADADDLLLAGGEVVREIAVVLSLIGSRHQHVDVLADDFRRRVAEELFAGGIDGLDDARSSIVMIASTAAANTARVRASLSSKA